MRGKWAELRSSAPVPAWRRLEHDPYGSRSLYFQHHGSYAHLWVHQCSYSTTWDTLDCWTKLLTEDCWRDIVQLQVSEYFTFHSSNCVLIVGGITERNINSFSSLSLRIYLIFFSAGTDCLASHLFTIFLILSRMGVHSEHSLLPFKQSPAIHQPRIQLSYQTVKVNTAVLYVSHSVVGVYACMQSSYTERKGQNLYFMNMTSNYYIILL